MARTAGSHSDITGPRIHDAALRLFAQKGYAAVSMREIAREVGVQAGALYNYTPDKQSLLVSLLTSHMEDLLTAWASQSAARHLGDTPYQRLERFTRFHIAYHLARPDAVFVAYMELRNLTPVHFTRVEALRHQYETELETILQDGARVGQFTVPDSKLTTLAVIAMLTGVTTWYRPGGRLSAGQVADHYWAMVRGAVGANA